jgi:hypothetical protein
MTKTKEPDEPMAFGPEILAAIPGEYLAAMGRVAAAWAILDFELDMTICDFAQTPQFLGICVTSQIFSTPSRLNALGALLRAHGLPQGRIKWLDKFQQKTHGLARKRNRAVHDAIAIGQRTGTIYRTTATLAEDRSVDFGTTPSTSNELSVTVDEITAHVRAFQEFASSIVAQLRALREKAPLSYSQILSSPIQPVSVPRPEDSPPRPPSSRG